MATSSSMHKPGWRSRRRSRLSLVERAVPRLGRMPKPEDSKPKDSKKEAERDDAGAAARPDDEAPTQPQNASEPQTPSPASTQNVRLVHARQMADTSDDQASDSSTPEPEEESDRASVQPDDGMSPEPSQDKEPSQGEEPSETDQTGLQTEGSDEPATSTEAPPATSAADSAEMTAEEPSATARTPPKTAADEAVEDAEPESDQQALMDDTVFRLNWRRLIGSGFVDPRDGRGPLAPDMDGIIRALIRQSLSDQASWRDRVILVTSPTGHASRTTASINFAFGLTTVDDHHAVLVDVNTNGSGAVDRLGGRGMMGITEALADPSIAIDDLVIATDLDRLTLVASGAPDDNMLDRFASRRMLEILRFLTKNPKTLLVIDAPSILTNKEAAVLSVVAGQVVMAVEAGKTTADQIEHALQRIGDRHNVSLVLTEASGVVRDDITSAEGARRAPAGPGRRAQHLKRRGPNAAAAGALALGLFASEPTQYTMPQSAHIQAPVAFSAAHAGLTQRWPIGHDATMKPSWQASR